MASADLAFVDKRCVCTVAHSAAKKAKPKTRNAAYLSEAVLLTAVLLRNSAIRFMMRSEL
jgi:hypothetical protein